MPSVLEKLWIKESPSLGGRNGRLKERAEVVFQCVLPQHSQTLLQSTRRRGNNKNIFKIPTIFWKEGMMLHKEVNMKEKK